jgi:hypothetical protein
MLPEFWFSFGYPYYAAFSSCLARGEELVGLGKKTGRQTVYTVQHIQVILKVFRM